MSPGLIAVLLIALPVSADPITPGQAGVAVKSWLGGRTNPLGAKLGAQIHETTAYKADDGQTVYYIVTLAPSGFVVVAADDGVEPIIAFSSAGTYDPSRDNPMGALVSRDVPGRVDRARQARGDMAVDRATFRRMARGRAKWQRLLEAAASGGETALVSVSDQRVAPFVQTRWSQSTACLSNCYNYYTPNNYVCGCVATALAQTLRFFEHPMAGIGVQTFTIWVDDVAQDADTRGGDGSGGAYDWAQMPLTPGCATTVAEREAIGALCYDAGVSVYMSYKAGGSASDTLLTKNALTTTFDYSNATKGYNGASNIGAGLNAMVNPNLDAGRPVILGITGPAGGHAIVTDGYGYDSSTLYHHLNMGWAGGDDAWYNLPDIDSSPAFTSVYKCVYNIFITGTGEIISGRVIDASANPISGAAVSADTFSDTTDSEGIYALEKVASNTAYTVSVTKVGYVFNDQAVTTATSSDFAATSGNLWGVDFQEDTSAPSAPSNPDPSDGASDVPVDADMNWSASGGVTYDVFFGTDNPPATKIGSDIAVTTCDPGALAYSTTYYWQIVAKNGFGDTAGPVWSFTTVAASLSVAVQADPNEILVGQSSDLTASVTGGTAPYTYSWSTGDTDPNITVSPTVTTDYTVTVTDSLGQTADASVTVTVVEQISATFVADPNIVIAGQSSQLTAAVEGGQAPFTYLWNGGETSQSITVQPDETTTYSVTVTDNMGQEALASGSVIVVSELSATVQANPETIELGQTSTLTVTPVGGQGPYAYHWNTGQTTEQITVDPVETTTYTVSVTDAAGQTAQAEATVSVKAVAGAIELGPGGAACCGGAVPLQLSLVTFACLLCVRFGRRPRRKKRE